jgi:hypothetical protein
VQAADDKADHHEEKVCLSKSNNTDYFMHGTEPISMKRGSLFLFRPSSSSG